MSKQQNNQIEEQWLQELMRLNDEEDKKTDKQIKILQAAVEIFSEKGFAATSTSEIAQKAGVAEGTIFRHYKTKKELLLQIVGPVITRLIAPFLLRDFGKVIETPYASFEDFLRALARNRIDFARRQAKIIRILLHEVAFQPELQAPFKELFAKQVFQKIEKVFLHFQKEGQLIEAPPWRLMRHAAGSLVFFILFHLYLMPEWEINEEEELEHLIQMILFGIAGPGLVRK